MSMAEAVRLDLVVEFTNKSDGVYLDFGAGRCERSIGKVTLLWDRSSDPDRRYPPLIVECDVSESCRPGLIFGQPFIRERSSLWPKRRARDRSRAAPGY